MKTDFEHWLSAQFGETGPFTLFIVLVRIAGHEVVPLKSSYAHLIGDDMDWYENEYIPRVGKRGAEIIDARGASSAASAASAAIDHVRDWVQGADGLRSMAVRSPGVYDVEEGLVSSFPVRVSGGSYEIADGLEVDDFARGKIDATVNELKEERDSVRQLGLI